MKYLLIEIEERNGEQEYRQTCIREVANNEDKHAVAEKLASTWYNTEAEEDDEYEEAEEREKGGEYRDGEYWFLGDSIAVSVKNVQDIPKEHYDILKLYNI